MGLQAQEAYPELWHHATDGDYSGIKQQYIASQRAIWPLDLIGWMMINRVKCNDSELVVGPQESWNVGKAVVLGGVEPPEQCLSHKDETWIKQLQGRIRIYRLVEPKIGSNSP
ncbi:hypothetical protein YC2023_118598 [Brassica napus]